MHLPFKRYLFLAHRWLGVLLCAVFALWFVSGVVMMYVGYPKLTHAERLAHLPVLDARRDVLPPDQALARAGLPAGPWQELRLAVASGGRPVYLASPAGPGRGGVVVVDAVQGTRLEMVDTHWALASAAAWAGSAHGLRDLGMVQEDAFTHSRALDVHRPLHRVALVDAQHTWLYISGRTGEVVRDAPRQERLWNYAGAWLHWLYAFRGGVLDRYWSDVVSLLSIAGIGVAVLGTVVGLMRWRFRRPYRSGARSPYAAGWMRWHHVVGLLFAGFTLTWVFSGLMSMNPWKLFDSGAPALRMQALQGPPLVFSSADASPQALLQVVGGPVRELRWTPLLGRSAVLAYQGAQTPVVLDGVTAQAWQVPAAQLQQAVAGLVPGAAARVEVLTQYDLYYYAREAHTMMGGADKPLPIWRVVFDDPHATWVHLDPQAGSVLGRLDSHRRASRWWFAMLHSWDWLPLLERRPLWDGLLLLASLGGVVLSLSGVVIGWRRLRRKWA